MTLQLLMHVISIALNEAGAHHLWFGGVSDHLGWIQTKHWTITLRWRG